MALEASKKDNGSMEWAGQYGDCQSRADFLRLLEELKQKKIIIYGAGKVGRRVYRFCSRFAVPVCFFWDAKAELIHKVGEVPVLKPDFQQIAPEDRESYIVIVTIFSENVCQMIRDNLVAAGFTHTIMERKFINSLLYYECRENVSENKFNFDLNTCYFCPVTRDNEKRCDIFDDYVRNNFVTWNREGAPRIDFMIPSLGVLISNRCTLNCKGCNHLREYYQPSDYIDIAAGQLSEDLNKILDATDLINTLVIVGGEAFLHRDIDKIIERILSLPKIGIIHIITNGTVVVQKESIFKLLANPRIIVEISGYHGKIPSRLEVNVRLFREKLAKYGVNYRYTEQMQWFDFGTFENRKYSKEELFNVYSSCCFVSNDIFDGKLHKCSRSVFGNYLGMIPDFVSDYVDLRKTPPEELRAKLIKFFKKKYVEACRFCNGTSTHTMEAGQQLKKSQERQLKVVTPSNKESLISSDHV